MVTFDLGKNVYTDLRVMGGLVNANAPLIKASGLQVTKEEWTTAAIFQAGLNLRIGISKSFFVFAGADYMYVDPKFNYTFTPEFQTQETLDFHQKMTVINLTGGIGYSF